MLRLDHPLLRSCSSLYTWITNARSGSAAVILTLAWRLIIMCLNLANGIMVVRNLGPAGRGEQSVIAFWPLLLASILEFGIPCSVIYFARTETSKKREFYGAAMLLCLVFSALAVVIGIIGIPHWITKFNRSTIQAAQLFMFFVPFSMMTFFITSILDAEHDFSFSNYLRNCPTIMTTLGLIGLIITKHVSPVTTALMYFLPNIFFLIYVMRIVIQRYQPSTANAIQNAKKLLHYGLRVYGSTLIGTFGQQIDQLLVVGLLRPIDLGIYTVALSGSRVLTVLPYSTINILLPKIVGRTTDDIARLVTFVAKICFYATSLVGLVLAALMPYLMPFIFGKALRPGIPVAQILIIEVVLSTTTWILMQTYLALDRPAIVTFFQSVSLGLCIPLMLFLIPRFGLQGAALALLLSTCTRFFSAMVGYTIILKLPVPSFALSKSDLDFGLAFLKSR